MMKLIRTLTPCLLLSLLMTSCAPAQSRSDAVSSAGGTAAAPASPREFRAAWVASVGNSHWPRRDRSVEEQKQDMIALLDRCVALNLNAVVLQIRPGADALYKSDLEPWSEYVTGTQGQAPSPYYDPMELWITECHRRGLEFHAWFNPYRVSPGRGGKFAPNSIAVKHPEVVKKYGGGLWMDPGEPVAAQQTLAVLLDIVKRYDIDGIHTDDYYYPYPVEDKDTKKNIPFPDDESYARYQQRGGKLERDDWRRDNINQLVEHIYTGVRALKPWVKVGYAPFGIWKPENPPGIKGFSQFNGQYADPKLWLNKGWLDYLTPQLYWHIGGDQDFKALYTWWQGQNTMKRHVWPGVSLSKNGAAEILDQIQFVRATTPADPGIVYWPVSGLMGPRRQRMPATVDVLPGERKRPPTSGPWRTKPGEDLSQELVAGPYRQKALVPPTAWLDRTPPAAPIASATRTATKGANVTLRPGPGESTFVYAIHIRYGTTWQFTTLPGGSPGINLNPDPKAGPPTEIVVSAVDRTGNESSRVTLPVK